MNRIILIGNLTKAPEQHVTPQDVTVCTFTIAVNRRRRQPGEEPAYFRISAWRQLGESCYRYLQKGKKVAVTGELSARTYTGNDGQTRVSLEVTADEVEFLSPADQKPAAEPDAFADVRPEDIPF